MPGSRVRPRHALGQPCSWAVRSFGSPICRPTVVPRACAPYDAPDVIRRRMTSAGETQLRRIPSRPRARTPAAASSRSGQVGRAVGVLLGQPALELRGADDLAQSRHVPVERRLARSGSTVPAAAGAGRARAARCPRSGPPRASTAALTTPNPTGRACPAGTRSPPSRRPRARRRSTAGCSGGSARRSVPRS